MTYFNSALTESPSLRSSMIASCDDTQALIQLQKAKPLITKLWQGVNTATTGQIADYYGISVDTVIEIHDRNRTEFAEDWLYTASNLGEVLFKTRLGRDFVMNGKETALSYFENHSWTQLLPQKKSPVVYFILDTDRKLIKIGYTRSLEARFTTLQCGNPSVLKLLGICNGGQKEEHIIHKKFSQYKVRSEWFKDCKEIRDFISCLSFNSCSDADDLITWTPRAALRLGMIIQDSQVSKKVRDVFLDHYQRMSV